jgi:hypothetical protein
MSTPRLNDVRQTAEKLGVSPWWLYRRAGREIPVTRLSEGGRLFWTDEQIAQIIRDGAIEPSRKSAPPAASSRRRPASQPSTPAAAGTVHRLEARPEARRKGRRSA